MALDRQSIEKRDFPIGRRGYEPEAVDAHLAFVADEVEALSRRSQQQRSPATLAQAASSQVQAIVQAAEQTAAEIEQEADDDAARIRQEAQVDAQGTRDDAIARSQEHVAKVREATALMLQRVEAMETELKALVDSVRTGANRVSADLSLLEGNMGELYGPATTRTAPAPAAHAAPPAPAAAPAPLAEPAPSFESLEADPFADGGRVHELLPQEQYAPPLESAQSAPPPGGGDVEGARLIALNMALNGQSRDETALYLAENFDLPDADALLDEVYSTVEG